MTETKTVEVAKADREAAWPFRPEGFGPIDRDAWISGVCDHNQHIQAFARHRLVSQSLSTDEEVRRLVIAARRALEATDWASNDRERRERFRSLDHACEVFATRIPWDDAPDAALQSKDTPSHGG